MAIELEVIGTREAWGAEPANVRAVCLSVTDCFASAVAEKPLEPIRVEPGDRPNPRTLHARAASGHVRVWLSARERHWCQYAYQFGHEFGHVLANLRREPPASSAGAWLEEVVCEAGALFALAEMARRWPEHPPYRNWSDYGPAFTAYLAEYRAAHQRPAGVGFLEWFAAALPALERDPNRGQDYQILALRLAPVFATPAAWRAMRFLNLAEPMPFPACLEAWKAAAPASSRAVLERIGLVLGVREPRPKPLYTKAEYQAVLERLALRPAALTEADLEALATVNLKLAEQGRQARDAARRADTTATAPNARRRRAGA